MDNVISNWFNSLEEAFDGEKVNADSIFHFTITGAEGGEYTVTIKDKQLKVLKGLHQEPRCEITATDQNFKNVLLGISNPRIALANGKLQISKVSEVLMFAKPLGLL